jgi:uncharacterized delta-60 repeat protein
MQENGYESCGFNTKIYATVIILAFVVSARTMRAVDEDLDPTLGTDGKVLTDFDHSTDIANAVAVQADGKLVIVGTTYINNDYAGEDFAVARYNPDGTLDKTFGAGGKTQTDFPGLAAVASSVVVQSDGKIVLAGGAFPLFTFLGDFKLVRYNSNGSLDTSFGDGGVVTTNFPQGSYAFDVTLQPDGKIIAAGTVFVDFNPGESSNTDFALARYNPDGTPDATFGNGGQVTTDFVGFEDDAFSVLIQPDRKLSRLAPPMILRVSTTSPLRVTLAMATSIRHSAWLKKCRPTSAIKTLIGRARPRFNPMAGLSQLDSPSPKTEEFRILLSRAMTPTACSTPASVPTG